MNARTSPRVRADLLVGRDDSDPEQPRKTFEYLNVRTLLPPAAFETSGSPTLNWPMPSTCFAASSAGSAGGAASRQVTFDASIPAFFA